MTNPLVELRNLRKHFGETEVLKGIDASFEEGKVSCIIGPSGSGKTTMLRCINLLEVPDGGEVIVAGEHMGFEPVGSDLRMMHPKAIAKQREGIGFVFQRFNLFPHLTVLENVIEGPLRVRKSSKVDAVSDAMTLLDRVGMAEKAHAYPAELSGGQMQRVAIARALAMKPRLVLFDEPTSALDPELVGEVLQVMRDLAATGITMIVVTHEISFARDIANEVVFMADGMIVEHGSADDVLGNPQHARTRDFLQSVR